MSIIKVQKYEIKNLINFFIINITFIKYEKS